MLQRVQSLFLFLAAVLLLVFASATDYSIWKMEFSLAWVNSISAMVTLVVALLAFITIFLYRNRPRQISLCYTMAFLVVLAAVHHFYQGPKAQLMQWETYLLPISFILILLARTFINRDEKLVRSMDRLR